MRTRNIVLRIGTLAVILVLAGILANADTPAQEPAREMAQSVGLAMVPNNFAVQYMVKFVCGFVPPPDPAGGEPPPVKPGDYATAINIHNYTYENVRIQKRVALHMREGTAPPPIPPPQWATMYKLRVLEIDCVDIWNLTQAPYGTFVKGMVHIGTPFEVPVAAVYTVLQDIDGDHVPEFGGQSVDVEYVKPLIGEGTSPTPTPVPG